MLKTLSAAALLSAALFSGAAAAQDVQIAGDYDVKPLVTSLKAKPQTAIIIGNSYTYYNCGLFDYLWGFSEQSKTKLETQMATTAGAGLDWHDVKGLIDPQGKSWSYIFKKHDGRIFDVVILQGNSREPIDERMKDDYRKWAGIHAETIRRTGAEPAIMMTWAREGQPEMTKQLADATIEVGNANKALVIPVGLAFAEVKRTHPEITLIMPDRSHPTAAGSYLAGAVIWSSLTRESLAGNGFLGGCEKPLSPETARVLQETAWAVTKAFYGWKE